MASITFQVMHVILSIALLAIFAKIAWPVKAAAATRAATQEVTEAPASVPTGPVAVESVSRRPTPPVRPSQSAGQIAAARHRGSRDAQERQRARAALARDVALRQQQQQQQQRQEAARAREQAQRRREDSASARRFQQEQMMLYRQQEQEAAAARAEEAREGLAQLRQEMAAAQSRHNLIGLQSRRYLIQNPIEEVTADAHVEPSSSSSAQQGAPVATPQQSDNASRPVSTHQPDSATQQVSTTTEQSTVPEAVPEPSIAERISTAAKTRRVPTVDVGTQTGPFAQQNETTRIEANECQSTAQDSAMADIDRLERIQEPAPVAETRAVPFAHQSEQAVAPALIQQGVVGRPQPAPRRKVHPHGPVSAAPGFELRFHPYTWSRKAREARARHRRRPQDRQVPALPAWMTSPAPIERNVVVAGPEVLVQCLAPAPIERVATTAEPVVPDVQQVPAPIERNEAATGPEPEQRVADSMAVPEPEPEQRVAQATAVPEPVPEQRMAEPTAVPEPVPEQRVVQTTTVPEHQGSDRPASSSVTGQQEAEPRKRTQRTEVPAPQPTAALLPRRQYPPRVTGVGYFSELMGEVAQQVTQWELDRARNQVAQAASAAPSSARSSKRSAAEPADDSDKKRHA